MNPITVYINGKTCKFHTKALATWQIVGAVTAIDPPSLRIDQRILYVAKDGLPEMLAQYARLPIHEGMHIALITVDEFGQLKSRSS